MAEEREVIISSLETAPLRKDINPSFPGGRTILHRDLATDPDTGMVVQHAIYEKGICPPKQSLVSKRTTSPGSARATGAMDSENA